jgi:hypothetical protein
VAKLAKPEKDSLGTRRSPQETALVLLLRVSVVQIFPALSYRINAMASPTAVNMMYATCIYSSLNCAADVEMADANTPYNEIDRVIGVSSVRRFEEAEFSVNPAAPVSLALGHQVTQDNHVDVANFRDCDAVADDYPMRMEPIGDELFLQLPPFFEKNGRLFGAVEKSLFRWTGKGWALFEFPYPAAVDHFMMPSEPAAVATSSGTAVKSSYLAKKGDEFHCRGSDAEAIVRSQSGKRSTSASRHCLRRGPNHLLPWLLQYENDVVEALARDPTGLSYPCVQLHIPSLFVDRDRTDNASEIEGRSFELKDWHAPLPMPSLRNDGSHGDSFCSSLPHLPSSLDMWEETKDWLKAVLKEKERNVGQLSSCMNQDVHVPLIPRSAGILGGAFLFRKPKLCSLDEYRWLQDQHGEDFHGLKYQYEVWEMLQLEVDHLPDGDEVVLMVVRVQQNYGK